MYQGDRQELLTVRRAMALRAAPIARGDFDQAHLKAIHAFLFEPYAGTRYQPGQFRAEVPGWGKDREEMYYRVFYSKMDAAADERLEAVLKKMKPDRLAILRKSDVVNKLSELYAELDYIHPFYEGNSRTLREFFAQYSEEAGYVFDTEKLMAKSADTLYEARDKAVLYKVLEVTENEKVKADIQTTLNRELRRAPSLTDLFATCCHKMNTIACARFRSGLESALKNETDPPLREMLAEKLISFKKMINDRQNER